MSELNGKKINAEVISVFPNKVRITVDDLEDFKVVNESLRIGSYLRISDNEDSKLFAIIENFSIEIKEGKRAYMIEANPLGALDLKGEFVRGGDSIAIPPKTVEPASEEEISAIYNHSIKDVEKFDFSRLSSRESIRVPVDGNKFFNKHIAVVGSTGSGKSHTIATILQKAVASKSGKFSLNNSHIVIFDIHSEYQSAFPEANFIDINNLTLPYWLLNSEELEEILLDTGERDNYNQASVFRNLVTANKKIHNPEHRKVFYDSPLYFDVEEVKNALNNLRSETINAKVSDRFMIDDGSYELEKEGKTIESSGIQLDEEARLKRYFEREHKFFPGKPQHITKGDYADGTLDKFVARFSSKINQERLSFLFGNKAKGGTLKGTLESLMGYEKDKARNVTVIDLSGIPFEVLSITVSLISRLLFEYGYFYKRLRCKLDKSERVNNDVPLLLVYEEAHKYVPNSELTKYRSSKTAIERIAKEGRKYGITLLLASQRPSEISETIFSQCNSFIAMRLTNPNDQAYVRKLLPDSLGNLIDAMPSLKAGEALLMGESIVLPSVVTIDETETPPSSNDIRYWELWKEKWKELKVEDIHKEWFK